jgi:hypothetical protein
MSLQRSFDRTNRFSPDELAIIALAFTAPDLARPALRQLLGFLNGLTEHRFTGVYRFEPGWVVSVALFDRENPDMEIGADVKMKESYCWLTGLGEDRYVIEDATCDPRLDGHVAQDQVRSYLAVLLRDKRRAPWGTLCHFDFAPRKVHAATLDRLTRFAPLIEELTVKDAPARWDPDAPSEARSLQL